MQVVRVQSIVICKCHSLKGGRGRPPMVLKGALKTAFFLLPKIVECSYQHGVFTTLEV